jgi:hypothetical protein
MIFDLFRCIIHVNPFFMAKISLDITDKSIDYKADLADAIKASMTGNATYPDPDPPLSVLSDKAAQARARKIEAAAAKVAWHLAVRAQDKAEKELTNNLNQEGLYIQRASGGDKKKIESAGVKTKGGNTGKPKPAKVHGLSLAHTDTEGQTELRWTKLKGYNVNCYQFRGATELEPTPNWKMGEYTSSKTTLIDQTFPLGQRIWVEVRAVNAAGAGPWSDPATIIVA